MAKDYGEQKLINEMDKGRGNTIKFQTVTKDGVVKGDIRNFFINDKGQDQGTRIGWRFTAEELLDFRAGVDMLIDEMGISQLDKPLYDEEDEDIA